MFNKYIAVVLLLVMSIAFGGYQANIILFGIDQLQDASTDEITSFISWYWFMYVSGWVIVHFIDFVFDNSLLKEPITHNPFQLIYKVIKYAIKNKHLRCRSAFTYCEDEFPSRIDFGKSKYGGPFTTEEVENVKTFLRLLNVIFVGSAMAIGLFSLYNLGNRLIYYHHKVTSHFEGFYRCRWRTIHTPITLAYFGGTMLIPLHEFVVYPLLQKCLSCVQSYHWKLSVGVIISQIAKVIALMVIDVTARHSYLEYNNVTIQCIYSEESGTLSSTFNMKWMIFPHFLNAVSMINFFIGVCEFICSQTLTLLGGFYLVPCMGVWCYTA